MARPRDELYAYRFDDVVIARAVRGQRDRQLSRRELRAAVAQLHRDGLSHDAIGRRLGIRTRFAATLMAEHDANPTPSATMLLQRRT